MKTQLLKIRPMSATEIKAAITANLDKMDESLLKAIHALTETYIQELEEAALKAEIMAIPPDPTMKRYTQEELIAHLDEVEKEFDRGEFMTLEELKKESETW